MWWYMPIIPALGGRGRLISEFKARLVYRVSSRTAKTTQLDPVSKQQIDKWTKMYCSWEKKIGLQIMTDNDLYF